MLYLEDYLEMIEHLPSGLRDRFTEMREMDLSVQNRVDSLSDREKSFFSQCKKLKPAEREEEFRKIRDEYAKVIDESSEKISTAEDCYNLVDKYLRRLEAELHKFKMELEADHRGITEILEKRSLEMDAPSPSTSKENRLPKKHGRNKPNQTIAHGHVSSLPGLAAAGSSSSSHDPRAGGSSMKSERKSSVYPSSTSGAAGGLGGSAGISFSADSVLSLDPSSLGSPSGILAGVASTSAGTSGTANTYPLQHMGAGGNAIAAAASQAIAATQQLVPGRRTSSLKASYEAIHLGVQTHEFSIGRELAGAAQSAVAATALGGPMGPGEGSSSSGQSGPPSKRQKVNKRSSQSVDPGTPQPMLDVVNSSLMDGPESFLDASSLGMVSRGDGASGSGDLLLGGGQDPHGGAGSSQEGGSSANEGDWNFDPSEPRYCVCNQVSYGEMVACDNEDCPYEWFHYPCVGITATPKGKWYCSTCLARRKRK